jgi:hypothetical protein
MSSFAPVILINLGIQIMLILLVITIVFCNLFFNFVFMKSQLFEESPKTVQTSTGRWVRILPGPGPCYSLHDLVHGTALGQILVDDRDNWIYDGNLLGVEEQEEVAGQITGHQKEMTELLRSIGIKNCWKE